MSFYLSIMAPFLLLLYIINSNGPNNPHKSQNLQPITQNVGALGALPGTVGNGDTANSFGSSLQNHDIFANFDLKNGYNLPNQPITNNNEMQFIAQQGSNHSNVLLVTQWRAAGSFLGNLFNYHPDVFYLYEPQPE